MTSANQESASDEGAALDLHSLRRRRASPERAPFVDVDTYQGVASDPAHLHKYLYAGANPVMSGDPSGHDWSFAGVLAVSGITALVASILLPSIHGAWRQAYHVAANGTTQSLFTATFNGTATLSDWKRVLSGLGGGAGAGAINALDTLSFHLINPLNDYRNQLWRSEGLDQSWIGTTANGFAWTGTGLLYSAAVVYAAGFGRPTMDIAVRFTGRAPKFIHFQYGVNGEWEEALGERGSMEIYHLSEHAVEGFRFTVPILSGEGVLAADEAGFAYNCATAAMRAAFAAGEGGKWDFPH